MKGSNKLVSIHVAAWLLYVLILLLGTEKPGLNFWTNTISTIIPIIILFYLNIFFLFPRYLQHGKFATMGILIIIFNFGTICLRLLGLMVFQRSGIDHFLDNIFSQVVFWNQFRVNLLFIGISFAYWYAVKNYRSQRDQQKLQREMLDAKLNALRNQINPHFLYNTLSLIYAKSLIHSAELASAIARLSDMMRYSLGDPGIDG